MKKVIILSFLIFSSSCMIAQAGFRPGFIIKNSGDTLNGLLFYGASGKFSKSCLFKRFEIAQEFSYSANQIKAYGFKNGRYFESKKVHGKCTFLECLVQGEVSVYINPGKYKGIVFLQSKPTGFFKLDKGKNNLDGGGRFGNFRDALGWLLNNTGNKSVSTTDMEYDSKRIAAVVRESFSLSKNATKGFCLTPGINNIRDKSLFKDNSLLKIDLSGGYQFITVNTSGNEHVPYFTGTQFNNSYRPVIGVNINTRFSKIYNRWSVDIGLHYLEDYYYGYTEYNDAGPGMYRDDINIEFSEIQVPVALRLTLGKGSNRPYIKAGGYMSFLTDETYGRQSEVQYGNSVYTDYYEDFELGRVSGFIGGSRYSI